MAGWKVNSVRKRLPAPESYCKRENAMKIYLSLVLAALLLSGCALFYDAPRTDAAYGKAQGESWDRQVAFKDGRYADKKSEGLSGIPAEQIMKVYNKSFTKQTEGFSSIKVEE